MSQKIKTALLWIGASLLIFSVCFFLVTALCDWICKTEGYYQEAAQEGYVQTD